MDEILKDLPRYITLQQAAEMSQFSTETLRKAISDGKLMASKPGGGREIRILLSDFQFWMSEGMSEAMIDARLSAIANRRGPVLEVRMNAALAKDLTVAPTEDPLFLEKTLPWFKEVVKVLGGEWFKHNAEGLVTKIELGPKTRKAFGREAEVLDVTLENVDLLLQRKGKAVVSLHGNRKIAEFEIYSNGYVHERAWMPEAGPISAGGMVLREEHLIEPAAYAGRLLGLLT